MSGRWATSTRRSRLPSDWPWRVEQTKQRAGGLCEAEEHEQDCDGNGSECDHHERGDDHSLTNLRWLNHWCHQAKTQREAAAARRALYAKARRQPEQRPD